MQKTILAFIRSADMQKGGPTCRVGRPRCKKQFCISDGQPCMSALLFYCFTILLFYCFTISLQVQYCRGRCLGLAARDAKKFSTYHHVLQQNVVFASRTANLACRPSYSIFFTNLLFCFFTPRPTPKVWVSGLRGFSTPKKPVQQGIRTLSGPLTIRQADTYISH